MWFRRISQLEEEESSALLFDLLNGRTTSNQLVPSPLVEARKRKRGDQESDIDEDFSRFNRIRLIEVVYRLSNKENHSRRPLEFNEAMSYVNKIKVSNVARA